MREGVKGDIEKHILQANTALKRARIEARWGICKPLSIQPTYHIS